jgi:hypothetical protein
MGRVGRLLVLAVAALGLSGCSANKSAYDAPVLFLANGPVAVDVSSFNGDVSILTDPTAPYVSVRVRRLATHGHRRADEAKEALARVQYSVDIVRQDSGLVLKVKTWTDDPEPHFLRADLRIRLPELSSVSIVTQNGRVEAFDFQDEVNVQTTNGLVRLETRAPIVKPVKILNKRGDIEFQAGGGTSGNLECQAIGGGIDQRVRIGRLVILPGTDSDSLLATLNEGENPVQIYTTEGDITIAVLNLKPGVGPATIYQ